ncbi:MAG TPA: acyl-CoA dehydrogenase [Ilumatobacter sp.]|nr:acyl-CoA dehydrogenase [Ilumatobacter sp.]
MIDLEYDDVDAALAESVARLSETRLARAAGVTHEWTHEWWRDVAQLGILALNTPEGGGTVTTVAAAMESLGKADAPGPFVETFIAVQVLGEAAAAVVTGDEVATVATSGTVAWLPIASKVIALDDGHAYLARVAEPVTPVDSLAGEPWGRATLERLDDLGDAAHAIALGDVAAAAYLVGEADHLLTTAASYAADRVQFKNPIGNFQAVAHPLADCHLRLAAARTVTRTAAHAIDSGDQHAAAAAAIARRSATKAALETAYRSHQTYGAMGFTVEGPIGNRSAKIRQTSLAGHSAGAGTEHILRLRGL